MSKVNFPDVPEEDWNLDARRTAETGSSDGRRWIGVYATKGGMAYFVARKPESVPKGVLFVAVTDDTSGATAAAKKMLEDVRRREAHMGTKIEPGSVVTHADGQGVHVGVVLEMAGDLARMVFSTTNPDWSDQSRPMSDEEASMMGFSVRRRSYFVPVVRVVDDLSPLGRFFPEHRVLEMLNEFRFDE
jgi:hypothetical protein